MSNATDPEKLELLIRPQPNGIKPKLLNLRLF
jgi:hypothetical protein